MIMGKMRSKSQLLKELSDSTGLTRKDVASVLESLQAVIKKDLGKRGPGLFALPGLLKVKVVQKPATKAREGVNPFTGERMMFKAKPARKVVKVQALKGLKAMVA